MMSLNYILRKCTERFEFMKCQETISDVDIIMLFSKYGKSIGDSYRKILRYSQDSRNGIWHIKMCHAHNEKSRKKTNNGRK